MTVCLLAATLALSASPVPPADSQVSVGSSYLMPSIEVDGQTGNWVSISGELGGAATLVVDPNVCTFNVFGDATACTLAPVIPTPIRLVEVEISDPFALGRRVYEVVTGETDENKEFLVVPRDREGDFLFVQTNPSRDVVRITPLD